jgi:outer membrane murein-binding lipoprotein Lpp
MKKMFAIAAVTGLLLLAGCSSGGRNDSSYTSGSGGVPAAGAPPQQEQDKAAAPEGVKATSGPVEGRSLIYKGELSVRVDKVDEAATKLAAMVTTAGGFISADKRVADTGEEQAWLTVRVPSKDFQALLGRIAGLGEELSRNTNTEDVTEAIVDLDTRIAAQRASVESVRRMFAQAKQLSEVVLLERELSQRQAELASLEAKKRNLDNLVALSTITVSLVGPHTEVTKPKEPDPSFLGGLKAGWTAFVDSVQVASAVIGFLLPFLLAIAIPIGLLVWWLRRRRRVPPAPPASPAA